MAVSYLFIFLLLLLIRIDHLDSFKLPLRFQHTGNIKTGEQRASRHESSKRRAIQWDDSETTWENETKEDEKKSIELSYPSNNPIREMMDRAGMDISSMYQVFIQQGILLNGAILLSLIFNIDITHFETSSAIFASGNGMWQTILNCSAFLLTFTTLFNVLPIGPIKRLKRNAQFDMLEKYGLSPSPVVVAGSLLVAIGAGCVEELAFRGFCFGFYEKIFGGDPFSGLIFSSILDAIYHSKMKKTNPIIDFFIGVTYMLSFWLSGFNIVVPVVVHTIYEFISTSFTWLIASNSLKNRIAYEEKKFDEKRDMTDSSDSDFSEEMIYDRDEASLRALFGILDVDKNGRIDAKEWSLGLQLFGYGKSTITKGINYDMFGRYKDIDYDEFASAMRETLKSNKWPRRQDNIPEW